MFELVIFLIGYFGTDYKGSIDENPALNKFVEFLREKTEFLCENGSDYTWYIDKSSLSMTLFKLHFIVIFMYTMIFQIVLFIIPYKYDRLERTPSEEKADKKRRAKARKKKQQRNKNQLGKEVDFSIV